MYHFSTLLLMNKEISCMTPLIFPQVLDSKYRIHCYSHIIGCPGSPPNSQHISTTIRYRMVCEFSLSSYDYYLFEYLFEITRLRSNLMSSWTFQLIDNANCNFLMLLTSGWTIDTKLESIWQKRKGTNLINRNIKHMSA